MTFAIQDASHADGRKNYDGLADDLLAVYNRVKARMGDEDLEHIRNVSAYSQAIRANSRKLLMEGGRPDALYRGSIQYALHVLLEFSEIGHLIMHGAYDDLENRGEFDSTKWEWDLHCDPTDWKVMHHQNHHPNTNIVGKDHDLGYQIARIQPGQDWFGHHLAQVAFLPALLASNAYYFALLPAISAARTEHRSLFSPDTYKGVARVMKKHVLQDYLREPFQAGLRLPQTLIGNWLGTAAGHATILLLVAIEHHAPNTMVFHDPGPDETREEYYARQILATTNFTSWKRLDDWMASMLDDVDFPTPPPFRVFYGGLDTHLEHHLFTDLPGNRLREIQDEVREVCEKHGLPYNVMPFEDIIPAAIKQIATLSAPAGEREYPRFWRLATRPFETARRVAYGLRFNVVPDAPYLEAPKTFNASAKVIASRKEAGGQATTFRIAKPAGWDDASWDAGAFISLRVPVKGEELVRQYSLVKDSRESDDFEICVKRVADGRMSNHLNDALKSGKRVTIVGQPANNGPFILREVPEKALFIAGGVGITPIISMIRTVVRHAPKTDATLLYFNRDESSIIYGKELRELAAKSNLKIEFVCDKAGKFSREGHLSTKLVQELVPDVANRQAYVCAPAGLIDASRSILVNLGMPEENFHTESFAPVPLVRPTEGADKKYEIRFRRSGITAEIDGATTLLEKAREVGINVPTGCEQGLCRACVCPKLKGFTQHDEEGPTLARVTVCNSLPKSDIELDI
ncbi:FAD-binding oxidoreductase [Smaragdicoccus niigatensis]|uniref:FAD-binding oxidoreductase n=1 Tax=Smaragdicoccus niigatensis TaxID=359359 RepID=UPI000363B63A|nr:FAD-binding oxidoreductase [Smaragdicoccus niigatensis]